LKSLLALSVCKINPKPGAKPLPLINPKPSSYTGYINIAPLGLTLKSLLALSVCIIKARGNAPGADFFKLDCPNLLTACWAMFPFGTERDL